MPAYRKMYCTVCSGVSSVLDDMPDIPLFLPFKKRLTDILNEAEDIYIDTANVLELLDTEKERV